MAREGPVSELHSLIIIRPGHPFKCDKSDKSPVLLEGERKKALLQTISFQWLLHTSFAIRFNREALLSSNVVRKCHFGPQSIHRARTPVPSSSPFLLFQVPSMNRVVHVNATDRHITYTGLWFRLGSTMISSSQGSGQGSDFWFMFRGSIYAQWIWAFLFLVF